MKNEKNMTRRDFMRRLGVGAGSAFALWAIEPIAAMAGAGRQADGAAADDDNVRMTYRVQHGTGQQVSLLGFGMMRLPDDQDEVNRLVDYAIAHGVNYFDTAPMYKGGRNEGQTGLALSRYPREKYYVATKMSNYSPDAWSLEESKKIYEKSFRELRVDYIDYYLLHGVGQGGLDNLKARFLDNGLLDFLLEERKAGRIRHLGFSYHGDVAVFDWLLDRNEQYHWDFVQIQMNYLDWQHASQSGRRGRRGDADAEYLYNKLDKLGIQAVIMEPLRGGGLSRMSNEQEARLKALRPDDTLAAWAFRWVGSRPNVLTALSGMNRMDHLEENVRTFSPLDPCTQAENSVLAEIADEMAGVPSIPCTTCAYCMPCPYGVDIPGNFAYYNEALAQHVLPLPDAASPDYAQRKQAFIDGYQNALPDAATWARRCVDCEACLSKCPQQIRIPNQMGRIVAALRKG